MAAAVILRGSGPEGLTDSKKLTARRREKLAVEIRDSALSWSLGRAEVDEIDQMNILRASHLAMERAVAGLTVTPEVALDESAFRAGIASFRQKYEKVIVEAGAVTDPSAVDWISNFTDQDVVVVARGQMTKDEVASRVRRLSRPDSSPVALILVDPNRRRTWSRKQDDFGFSVPAHHTA